LKTVKEHKLEHEISCVSISGSHGEQGRGLCAVGTWTDVSVRLFRFPDLEEVALEALGGEIIPRSVLLCALEEQDYLMVALGDGHLLSFSLESSTATLTNRKKVSLGTKPITLKAFQAKGSTSIFAASDRPTVIYSHNKKLLYSTVNLREVTCMCSFNSESFPDGLAMATEESLRIGMIDNIQKLHVRTVPLGEQPRRICYMESAGAFGVICCRREEDGGEDGLHAESWAFKLIDDQTFEVLHEYRFKDEEWPLSCMATRLEGGGDTEYFVVGTGINDSEESDPKAGRIFVFVVSEGRLDLIHDKTVPGAVYCLSILRGMVLAGVNSRVELFQWATREEQLNELQAVCSHRGHILALHVKARGDFVVVGDLMKSLTLLAYSAEKGALEEIARDCNSNWTTAMEVIDDETFLGAEKECNFFTLKKNSDAATEEEKSRLEVVGEYHLGDMVNCIRRGSLVTKVGDGDCASAYPTLLYATLHGVLGVLAHLPHEQFQFLTKVQSAVSRVVRGVGGFEHAEWRSFHAERRTAEMRGFVDGDLIESFLDLSPEDMEKVVTAIGGTTVEEVTRVIDDLARLH